MPKLKCTWLKYLWLYMARLFRSLRDNIRVFFSYAFLVFGILTCLFILIPQCFGRVPALSYYISEHKLPMTYELIGEVKVLDGNGDAVNAKVTVFVGGYSASLTTADFSLTFTSPVTDEIPVTIRYEVENRVCESTQFVRASQEEYTLHEVFVVYA